jgi:peptidoglycan/LPS O-acetylase OafA/YrhL
MFLGYRFLDGHLAVQAFYVVSGFYMALILDTKYVNGYWPFILNRILRLYPVYLVCLALALAFYFSPLVLRPEYSGPGTWWSSFGGALDIWTRLGLIATNLLIEGKDLLCFMRVDLASGGAEFSPTGLTDPTAAQHFIFLPQAWSLGVEMHFYLLAPFFFRMKTWVLVAVFFASWWLRLSLFQRGFNFDPWVYRFFPSVLHIFIMGVLSYRLYLFYGKSRATRVLSGAATLGLGALLLLNGYLWALPLNAKADLTLAVLALSLPALFHWSREAQWDRRLGAFSYPIYLLHLIFADLWVSLGGRLDPVGFPVVLAATVLVSGVLVRYVELPADRWRGRLNQWLVSRSVPSPAHAIGFDIKR